MVRRPPFLRSSTPYGISLISILVGLALLGGLGLLSSRFFSVLSRQQSHAQLAFAAEVVRGNFLALFRFPEAWRNTVLDVSNVALACVRAGTSCAGAKGTIVQVRDASNRVYFQRGQGFDASGASCASVGVGLCRLVPEISWEAICADSDCLAPQVKLVLTLGQLSTQKASFGLNPKKRGFEIYLESHFPLSVSALHHPKIAYASRISRGPVVSHWKNGDMEPFRAIDNEPVLMNHVRAVGIRCNDAKGWFLISCNGGMYDRMANAGIDLLHTYNGCGNITPDYAFVQIACVRL